MPKKQKKILTRKSKTKNKNTVNVKINIDNSRKTTARRTPIKPSNMQPFVNFPTFQPARIQQLEPVKKYNNGDLTKVDDLYQQQFKTYFETSDKNIKDMIAKFDDTLKKNIAPQKTEESKPGASKVYADTEGNTVFEEPSSKTSIGLGSQSKSNGFNNNNILNADKDDGFGINKLFDPPIAEAKSLNLTEIVKGAGDDELNEGGKVVHNEKISRNVTKKYEEYKDKYIKYYEDKNYEKEDSLTEKGGVMTAANWGVKASAINKKIKRYGTLKKFNVIQKQFQANVKATEEAEKKAK